MDSLTSLGMILLYGMGLVIAYNGGERRMKQRYMKLIRILHIRYKKDINTQSDLLSDLYDIEDYYE